MTKRRRDQIQNGLLLAAGLGILGWAATQILSIEPHQVESDTKIATLEEKTDENRDSIQALIDLHLKK